MQSYSSVLNQNILEQEIEQNKEQKKVILKKITKMMTKYLFNRCSREKQTETIDVDIKMIRTDWLFRD